MKVWQRAREVRLAKDLSQKRLADLAGVQRSRLQEFESGGNVTIETIEKVMAPLGLTLFAVTDEEIATLRRAATILERWFAAGPAVPLPVERRDDQADDISPELREKIRQLDAAVDRNRRDT